MGHSSLCSHDLPPDPCGSLLHILPVSTNMSPQRGLPWLPNPSSRLRAPRCTHPDRLQPQGLLGPPRTPLPLRAPGGQGKTQQEAGLPRLVGGSFNKQGNLLPWLALGCCRTSSSPHPPTRTLNVSIEASMGVQSHIPSRGARQHLTLSRPCPWNDSHCANCGQNARCKDREGVGEASVVQVQLEVQPVVMSSQ